MHTIFITFRTNILHLKVVPACTMASKLYDWDLRNNQNLSKNYQQQPFLDIFFSFFSKTVHTIRTKFSKIILYHIRVLYVQFHQNRMTGIRASQKEKDLRRLLYRTCDSGFSCHQRVTTHINRHLISFKTHQKNESFIKKYF